MHEKGPGHMPGPLRNLSYPPLSCFNILHLIVLFWHLVPPIIHIPARCHAAALDQIKNASGCLARFDLAFPSAHRRTHPPRVDSQNPCTSLKDCPHAPGCHIHRGLGEAIGLKKPVIQRKAARFGGNVQNLRLHTSLQQRPESLCHPDRTYKVHRCQPLQLFYRQQ